MNLISKLLKTAILGVVAMMSLSTPALAATNPLGDVCDPNVNSKAAQSSICNQAGAVNKNTDNPVAGILHTTANILALIASIIAVIMIIISGLSIITSQGNAEAIKGSRNRIIYSVVGIILIAMAWTITTFIANHL